MRAKILLTKRAELTEILGSANAANFVTITVNIPNQLYFNTSLLPPWGKRPWW